MEYSEIYKRVSAVSEDGSLYKELVDKSLMYVKARSRFTDAKHNGPNDPRIIPFREELDGRLQDLERLITTINRQLDSNSLPALPIDRESVADLALQLVSETFRSRRR